jgi:hypothetical protein
MSDACPHFLRGICQGGWNDEKEGGFPMIEDFLVECDCCGWIVLSTAPCKCTLEEASQ